MEITSRDNRLVKEIRRLLADARYRRMSGRMALEGARLCTDAVRSGVRLETVLYTARAARQYPQAVETLLGRLRAGGGDHRTACRLHRRYRYAAGDFWHCRHSRRHASP